MIGFLNINKPAGMTSHDVVMRVRRLLKIKQVGHAGTLDPMATGVLPLAVGKACRLLRFLPTGKVYVAEVLLGTKTTTDDLEGEVIAARAALPGEEVVARQVQAIVGTQMQVPPDFSAVKVQGERLYALARRGKMPADVPARQIAVHSVELLDLALPVVRLRIACSGGTYIRSIARDLGERLSCGGCLKSLLREESGLFRLSEAISLDELVDRVGSNLLASVLISPLTALALEKVSLDADEADRLVKGQRVRVIGADGQILATRNNLPVAVCRAIGEGWLQPEVVIIDADEVN